VRLVLLGPPGAGKGTQAVSLCERLNIPHIATGDLLRAAVRDSTPLGNEAKRFMDAGELVPDGLVLRMLRDRLEEDDAKAGFLLDGFPRNPMQAEALSGILDELGQGLDAVIAIDVDDDEIVERLSTRAMCPACGRIWGSTQPPPGPPGVCEVDGTALVRRDDDTPEVVQHRLNVYRDQTEPLIAYYEGRGLLRKVNGVGDRDAITARIEEALADR
jgi:adenylate kinase